MIRFYKFFALSSLIMAYGWAYRGTVGHEGGAMLPGALLGMAVALGSGRLDWHRRSLIVGLFAAAGWAWGGSLSYMEQTFYVRSDSFPDVLYGYSVLFFLGALWAGIGGGVMGLALTEPRSELERLARPFSLVAAVFFAVYIYLFFATDQREALETLTVRQFHDGDWLPATLALVASGLYWLLRPKDRPATILFVAAAFAWWVGYGLLTHIGGLRLGPLHRSESWGGVLGILVAVLIYLVRRNNRAALMLCRYGILSGGIGFALAVFVRHPLITQWGVFADLPRLPQWRIAEASFGLFMGFGTALGVLRLVRGRLQPPVEDRPRAPLDVFAAFVLLIALVWINFRRHAEPSTDLYGLPVGPYPFVFPLWLWYCIGGLVLTLPVLYGLSLYLQGNRALAPASAFGKGATVALLLLGATVAGYTFDDVPRAESLLGHLVLWLPALLSGLLLVGFSRTADTAGVPVANTAAASDSKWRVGSGYWITCSAVPVILIAITFFSMQMQEGDQTGGRKRFGPEAYWRQTARLLGTWRAIGRADSPTTAPAPSPDLSVLSLEFTANRDVNATLAVGEVVALHRWFLKDQYTWLNWYGKEPGHPESAEVPLEFRGERIYITWPPHAPEGGYLVFERVGG